MDDFITESMTALEKDRQGEAFVENWDRLSEEPKYIVKEMMGDTYATFFEEEDSDHPDPERLAMEAEYKRDAIREEIALNHAQDNQI